MKKVLLSLIAGLLIFSTMIGVKANSPMITSELNFDHEHKAEDYLDIVPDTNYTFNEMFINKEDIEVGLATQNTKNNLRSGERWVLTSSAVSYEGVLQCKLAKVVEAGISTSASSGFSFSVSGEVKGFNIQGTVNFGTSFTYNGPSGNEAVGSYYATHRLFIAVASGKIMKYTYNIYDTYSGNLKRTETQYQITNSSATPYAAFAHVNANGNYMILRSLKSDKVHWFNGDTNRSWKTVFENILSSSNGWSYIYF